MRVLAEHEVRYVVVGGLAAAAQGAGRVTFDIDVVPEWSNENLRRLARALRTLGARLRVPDAAEPVEMPVDVRSLRGFEVSTWRTDAGDLDVIMGTPTTDRGRLAGFDDLVARSHQVEAYGLSLQVADLQDIIESKQVLAREPDLAALPELRRLQARLGGAEHDAS